MKLNQANGGSMVNPLRGRRPEKESYRGDVMVLMMLVITLLFQVAAKSSDDVFSPLKDLSSCDCHGSGPTWDCDCTPYAFVIYHVLLAVGFSVSVLSLMRIIFQIQHCFWLLSGILGVVLAFAWTVYSATPIKYRQLVFVIDVMGFIGMGILMLLVAYYQIHWVSLKILKKAASLVWTALQYGIVAIWTLTQFVFGQGWHACKTCGTSLKHLWDEAFIRALPPDDAAPIIDQFFPSALHDMWCFVAYDDGADITSMQAFGEERGNVGIGESSSKRVRVRDGTGYLYPSGCSAWFPFVSEFQTRLLFNQAFSRGLQIQRIPTGGKKHKTN